MELTASQIAALEHVAQRARAREAQARAALEHVLRMSNVASEAFERAVEQLRAHGRVALHFHPDRLDAHSTSVAEALLAAGVYKSQFETRLSNGGLTAYPGGARDRWEERMFGGAYHGGGGAAPGERPKYGAWDLMRHPDGPAPRFGSCFFLLRPAASRRCTFTYLDSHQDPAEQGTLDALDDVLAGLFVECFVRDGALGARELRPARLVEQLARLDEPPNDPAGRAPGRSLDHYVEAQVHGRVSLADDVEALVADPSFQGTPTGALFEQLGARYGIALRWHGGFALRADEVPSDFRGPGMPSLARRVARAGWIDASAIGAATVDLARSPEGWADRGRPEEVLQELKLLWHVLVKFGRPSGDARA